MVATAEQMNPFHYKTNVYNQKLFIEQTLKMTQTVEVNFILD